MRGLLLWSAVCRGAAFAKRLAAINEQCLTGDLDSVQLDPLIDALYRELEMEAVDEGLMADVCDPELPDVEELRSAVESYLE